jgi:hypothetical protein
VVEGQIKGFGKPTSIKVFIANLQLSKKFGQKPRSQLFDSPLLAFNNKTVPT